MIGNRVSALRAAAGALLALGLAGCATTHVEATWSNPEYAGHAPAGRVFVVGLTRDDTARRLYEDAMTAELRNRGVDAVRSYDSLGAPLADGGGSMLIDAARKAGATRVLATALVSRQNVQRVTVEPVPYRGWDYYGWYGYYWPYGYARAETQDFERYYVSTTLTDAASGRIYWSARTRSDAPGSIEKEIRDFVAVLADTLARGGLL